MQNVIKATFLRCAPRHGCLAVMLLLVGAAILSSPVRGAEKSRAIMVPVHGAFHDDLGEFFQRRMDEVAAEKPEILVFEIDSPGGDVFVMEKMIKRLEQLDESITTVAYIPNRALSAAAIFSLACDRIVMGSEARMGDAGPLIIGEDAVFRHAPAKIRSELVTRVRILADRHHRPGALAEAMIDEDAVVFEAIETESGAKRYFTDAEWDSFADQAKWERGLPVHESRRGVFLEVTGRRALELGLAEATAENEAELVADLKVEGGLLRMGRTWVDSFAMILSSPLITILLIVIGIVGLLVELSAPGMGIGGLMSLLGFGLFFWSRFLGGTAGWLEVSLLIIGAVFIAAELFVLPGFGIAGITGIGLMLLALLMAMRHSLIPQSAYDLHQLGQQALTLGASVVFLLTIALCSGRYIVKLPMIRRLTLAPPQADDVMPSVGTALDETVASRPSRTIDDLQVGEIGTADSPLRPGGRARFGDLLCDVLTEGEFLDRHTPIQVVSRSGYRVVVRSA